MRTSFQLFVLASVAAFTSAAVVNTCTAPEVRKEWRELSGNEQQDYLKAALCLREKPSSRYPELPDIVQTRMDDFVWTHSSLNTQIHFVANFLPWHRWYVLEHEKALRVECGYKGTQPYWNWSIDADAHNDVTNPNAVLNSPIFSATTGFGGNGRLTGNDTFGYRHCLADGPFANQRPINIGPTWPDFNAVINVPHCLTRELNSADGIKNADGTSVPGAMQPSAYNTKTVERCLDMPDYAQFSEILEGLPHAQVHSILFGDMGPKSSPNEPLFFLHHANIDRLWAKWQAVSNERLVDYSGFNDLEKTLPAALTDIMPTLDMVDQSPAVKDYMNVRSGPNCYTYTNI